MLLCIFGVVGKVSAHPFYVSVTEVRVDTKKSMLSVSCRMFTDDIENALTKIYGHGFDLQRAAQDKRIQAEVDEYIRKRFSVGIGGILQELVFLGMEQEDDAMWFYLESTNFKNADGITVTNSLLYDFLPDQINVIHFYVDGDRRSTRLVNPDKVAGFRF